MEDPVATTCTEAWSRGRCTAAIVVVVVPAVVRWRVTSISLIRTSSSTNSSMGDRIPITTEQAALGAPEDRRAITISTSFMGARTNTTGQEDKGRQEYHLVSSSSFIIRISLRCHQCQAEE